VKLEWEGRRRISDGTRDLDSWARDCTIPEVRSIATCDVRKVPLAAKPK